MYVLMQLCVEAVSGVNVQDDTRSLSVHRAGGGGGCLMWEVSPLTLLSCTLRPLIKHVIKGPLPNQS